VVDSCVPLSQQHVHQLYGRNVARTLSDLVTLSAAPTGLLPPCHNPRYPPVSHEAGLGCQPATAKAT